jgi:hypothetical protein
MLGSASGPDEPIALLSKDYRGHWMTHAGVSVGSRDLARAHPVTDHPLHVKLVYRAWRATYDVFIDGRPFALGVQHDPRR